MEYRTSGNSVARDLQPVIANSIGMLRPVRYCEPGFYCHFSLSLRYQRDTDYPLSIFALYSNSETDNWIN